jgi:hypothetical protein
VLEGAGGLGCIDDMVEGRAGGSGAVNGKAFLFVSSCAVAGFTKIIGLTIKPSKIARVRSG